LSKKSRGTLVWTRQACLEGGKKVGETVKEKIAEEESKRCRQKGLLGGGGKRGSEALYRMRWGGSVGGIGEQQTSWKNISQESIARKDLRSREKTLKPKILSLH